MNMEPLMELAVRGNARSHDLAEAVDIVSVDSQLTLYLGSHFLSPRLCSVDGCLQLNLEMCIRDSLSGGGAHGLCEHPVRAGTYG